MHSINTIDLHTEGEPLRIIVDGFPELEGDSILARRDFLAARHDHLRRSLLWEPRGHVDMYGALPVRPERADSHVGVLFLHNEGYSTMCGHAIIGLVKAGVEHALFDFETPEQIRIDTPAGQVQACAEMEGGRVTSVRFRNVPSFLLHDRARVTTPEIGVLQIDLAYGGAFYAVVDAAALGLAIDRSNCRALTDAAMKIKAAVSQQLEISHPDGDTRLGFLYGTILTGPADSGRHSRNVCVFADGEVDRSPTGTGVSARAAIHYARGELSLGQWIDVESIIGSHFSVRVVEEARVGAQAAVVPEVRGRAWVTGEHCFHIDPEDPLRHGFLLRQEPAP
ncbi:MAG: proline racemase family protein [Xanthomonadales bacterium]|nr:proline racemase family protein [Xanthomonadales bacterium]